MNPSASPKSLDEHKNLLVDLIAHNADTIRIERDKSRKDGEYLALCMVADDLAGDLADSDSHEALMALLQDDYEEHFSDVVTYVGWSLGQLHLAPQDEQALRKRHRL